MGEVPDRWRKANVTFKKGQKGDPGSNRPVSLTSVPGKSWSESCWSTSLGTRIGNSQHGFTKSNLIAYYNVDGQTAVDVFCASFMLKYRAVVIVGTQRGWRKGLRGSS